MTLQLNVFWKVFVKHLLWARYWLLSYKDIWKGCRRPSGCTASLITMLGVPRAWENVSTRTTGLWELGWRLLGSSTQAGLSPKWTCKPSSQFRQLIHLRMSVRFASHWTPPYLVCGVHFFFVEPSATGEKWPTKAGEHFPSLFLWLHTAVTDGARQGLPSSSAKGKPLRMALT